MTQGERIRELRLSKGLTQVELGEMIGSKQDYISHVERNATAVGDYYKVKFAKALDVGIEDLFFNPLYERKAYEGGSHRYDEAINDTIDKLLDHVAEEQSFGIEP